MFDEVIGEPATGFVAESLDQRADGADQAASLRSDEDAEDARDSDAFGDGDGAGVSFVDEEEVSSKFEEESDGLSFASSSWAAVMLGGITKGVRTFSQSGRLWWLCESSS